MKKLLLAAAICGITGAVQAQEYDTNARSVIIKFTETWCEPCGTWGWDLAERILGDIGDRGYYIGVMGSSTPSSMNAISYNAFRLNYTIPGFPTFFVNEIDSGYRFAAVRKAYEAFAETTPVASPAGSFSIADGKISVDAKCKFWSADSGEYYLAALAVEDKVMAAQYGRTGIVAHHNILRGTMNEDRSPWGMKIASGEVAADAEFTNTFSMTLKTGWVAENMSVLLVIYKKESGKYKVVNARKLEGEILSLKENHILSGLSVFPNPSQSGDANLEISLTEPKELSLTVTDVTGRLVFNAPRTKYLNGTSLIGLPASTWSSGIYYVNVLGEEVRKSTVMVINH